MNKNAFARLLLLLVFNIFTINSFIFSLCFRRFSYGTLFKTLLVTSANLLISAIFYIFFLKKIAAKEAKKNFVNRWKIIKNWNKIAKIALRKGLNLVATKKVSKNEIVEEKEESEDSNDADSEALKKKIKDQKKSLKKKIEIARKNAYKTRKPKEIEKTEATIRDILEKYHLTEELLDEDD
ncbi:MAG: hypothetical protein LBB13_00330 [Rickettsiales bacterium]|nr:hypothetical protein [Rickettsiales bacterium]